MNDKSIEENNKYCRNCGSLIKNIEECAACHTKIINKRVRTDSNYIILILINIMLITLGIIFDNGLLLLIALLVIIHANQKYSKVPIVRFLHNIEVTLVALFLIFIIYTFVSCMSGCL